MKPNPIIITMARRLAVKAIERELRAKGEKVAYIERAVINAAARKYFDEHRELIAEAERVVRKHPALQKMADRYCYKSCEK